MLRRAALALPPRVQQGLRRLGRLRWLEKSRQLRGRRPGGPPLSALEAARYVLLSPEVGDFTYDLANEDELLDLLADTLEQPRAELAAYAEETRSDALLTASLSRRRHLRLDVKRRIELGRNIGSYIVVRAVKPRLVVETGIKHGVGSLALLVALERNAAEGRDGRLMSFDVAPGSGWLVPVQLHHRWEVVLAPTEQALEEKLTGREVDVFVHDTPPDEHRERLEYEATLRHTGSRLVLLGNNGDNTLVLPTVAAERGMRYRHFAERPANHWYLGPGMGIAVHTGQ